MQKANLVSLRARVGAVALMALSVVGCGSGKAPEPDAPPKTVYDHFTIDVGGHPTSLQLAVRPAEQQRGLMQRADLGKNEGMLFVDARPQRQNFWMHNTPEALDIGFLSPDGVVVEIYPLLPYDERTVSSHSDQLQFALEMPQGWFVANGVRPGARVDLKAVAAALKARGFDPAKFGLP